MSSNSQLKLPTLKKFKQSQELNLHVSLNMNQPLTENICGVSIHQSICVRRSVVRALVFTTIETQLTIFQLRQRIIVAVWNRLTVTWGKILKILINSQSSAVSVYLLNYRYHNHKIMDKWCTMESLVNSTHKSYITPTVMENHPYENVLYIIDNLSSNRISCKRPYKAKKRKRIK